MLCFQSVLLTLLERGSQHCYCTVFTQSLHDVPEVSHLPCNELSLQLPALLLQSFNLLVFRQESTGLLCQVLGTLAGKCFFTQLQAGTL